MKSINLIKRATLIGCVCSGGLVAPASALLLTVDQSSFLGEFERGGGGKRNEEIYINQLVHMTPGSTDGVERIFRRSDNLSGFLPDAAFKLKVNHPHDGIVLDGTFAYVLASYGSATAVWYVGGLTGNFDLPDTYNGKHALDHYSLFGVALAAAAAGPKGISVSDTGSTLALLGLGLTSLSLARKKLGTSLRLPRK